MEKLIQLSEEEVLALDAFRASVNDFTKLATDKTKVGTLISYIACKAPISKDKAKVYVSNFLDRIDTEDLNETVTKTVKPALIPEDDEEETIEDIIEEADTVDVTYLID